MTDYNNLTTIERVYVDKRILEEITPGHFKNKHTGFEWDEPESTLYDVHRGFSCAKCFRSSYTCLCSHDS